MAPELHGQTGKREGGHIRGQGSVRRVLILACGALAPEIIAIKKSLSGSAIDIDLQCLPADYHNYPTRIVPALKAILDVRQKDYDRVLIGYGDCGTGGLLDEMIKAYDVERLPGAHCYAFFAGEEVFDDLMEQEPGTLFLTDYLVKFFDRIFMKGLGLDRYPHLRDDYFRHYRRLVYLAQTENRALRRQARQAAEKLGLAYEYLYTGYGLLERDMKPLLAQSP